MFNACAKLRDKGETISLNLTKDSAVRFRVSGIVGKGVFSVVVKVVTESNSTSALLPRECAVKFIRHNETMANAATREIKVLQRLRKSLGVISLLLPSNSSPLEYRGTIFWWAIIMIILHTVTYRVGSFQISGHTILVFPHMEYNLRDLLKK